MLWTPKYSVSDEEIDKHHKVLFEIMERLMEFVKAEDNYDHYDEILEVFKELSDYTVYHFGYEEKLFEKYKYDAVNKEVHLAQHAIFIKKIASIDEKSLDHDQTAITMDVVSFCITWLKEHILQTDMKFGDFLKNVRSVV